MSDKLEACPFCGGEAFLNHPHNGSAPFVMCGQCNACGPQSEAAVIGWTLRTPTPEQAGEVGDYARKQADHWLEDMDTSSRDAKHVSLMAMAGNCIRYGANGHLEPVRADQQRANINHGGGQPMDAPVECGNPLRTEKVEWTPNPPYKLVEAPPAQLTADAAHEMNVDDVRDKIRNAIKSSGLSQNAFAKSRAIPKYKLSEFLSGKRSAEPGIVEPLGYRWVLIAADDDSPTIHPETAKLVRDFAAALLEKLAKAEAKYGYRDDWRSNDWEAECKAELARHVAKGDPLDVGCYAAFCWARGWSTAQLTADAVERVCKVIAPDLFDEDQVTSHRAASPLRVDAAQGKVRDQARAILTTMAGDYVMREALQKIAFEDQVPRHKVFRLPRTDETVDGRFAKIAKAALAASPTGGE